MINCTHCSLIFSFLICLFSAGNSGYAQCNNQVDIATDCGFLFLLDGTIIQDGFCTKLPDVNPIPELTPFCLDLSSSENTGFFLIEPKTSTLYLRIKSMDCTEVDIPGQGIFSGMQAAIFTDCSFEDQVACAPLCNDEEFLIGGTEFIPFQTYLLVFDGCNGSICDFEIGVHSGALSEIVPLIEPVLNTPEEVCSNESIRIQIQGLPILTEGSWSIDGVNSFQTLFNGKAIEVNDWGAAGTKEVCAQINDPQTGEIYFDSCWIVDVIQAPIINSFPEVSALCQEDMLSLYLEGSNFQNIIWSGPGLSCNGCPNPVLTMPDSSVVITATAVNAAGCEEKITLPFTLVADPNCFVGSNDIDDLHYIEIAPNPFQNYFSFTLDTKSEVNIYNSAGQIIYSGKNIEGDQRLESSSWQAGIYFIQVKSDIGIGTRRILKL